jgi:tetratricopeptide (TPR) repeat protein
MRIRRLHLQLLTVVLLASASVPAAAGVDDGGVRSPFALGAGNRALGMGGAYAAIADDASAALWNPAGLAALDRRRLEASHTTLFGMGFAETYFSFALPHWRWGNSSLTIRQFGVDGIERRDDRNLLLADDLQDSETEILLAHGRTLRPGLDWGVGIKYQRQSLAGYAGGGLGLDAGLLVHPLVLTRGEAPGRDAWSIGLAVRNLLEPKIRLDRESVPDPRALRLGTAWRRALAAEIAGLASLDLEKTAGMGTRTHLGLEVGYRDLAAVRVGLLAGSFTAGLGVRWRDVAVDFAFEDHRFGSVERIGLTLLHGPSVREMRDTALARAEAERRRRVAEVYAENERLRRLELLDAVRTALAAGDHETARGRVDMMLVLDPGDAEAHALELEILRTQARNQEDAGDLASALITLGRLAALAPDAADVQSSLTRLHALNAASSERSRELQQLYADGLDAFAIDDLEAARRLFNSALALSPDDADVGAMLERVERARTQRLAVQLDAVRSFLRAGLVEEADKALAAAGTMGADAAVLGGLARGVDDARRQRDFEQRRRREERERQAELAALSGELQAAAPSAVSANAATPVSPARRAEMDRLLERARELRDGGRVDESVRLWEMVWTEDPYDVEARDALRQEYLSRGMEHFSAGRLEEAVDAWENALRVDPDDPRTRSYLERGSQQLARIRRLQQDTGR